MTNQIGGYPPNNTGSPMPVFEGAGALSNMPIKGFLNDNIMKSALEAPKIFGSGVLGGSVTNDLSQKAEAVIGMYSLKMGERGIAGETDGVTTAIREYIPDKSAAQIIGFNKGRNDSPSAGAGM